MIKENRSLNQREKSIKHMKVQMAERLYDDYLKRKKIFFHPQRRTAKEQNNHIMSLHLKKMIAKERLEIKYEDQKIPKNYTFKPSINYTSREIAREIRRSSTVDSRSRSRRSERSQDKKLLTTVRSKSGRRRFYKSPALSKTSRTRNKVIFKHDGGVLLPGESHVLRQSKTTLTVDSKVRRKRDSFVYEKRRKSVSRSFSRRERYGEVSVRSKRGKKKRKKRSKSRKSGVIKSRNKSMSRLAKTSRRNSLYSNPNPRTNKRKSLIATNVDLDNIEFIESSKDKLNFRKQRKKSRKPFKDIFEASNRLHMKARELEKRKKVAKRESVDHLFKPKLNRQKEICKQNVKRLIQVLDMRFNKMKKTNDENVINVQVKPRVNHQKIPQQLYKNRKRIF